MNVSFTTNPTIGIWFVIQVHAAPFADCQLALPNAACVFVEEGGVQVGDAV